VQPIISKSIEIIVFKGKAYLPTLAQPPEKHGSFFEFEPVYKGGMSFQELLPVMRQLLEQGHRSIPSLTQEDLDERYKDNMLLRVMEARSWREYDRKSICYAINWLEDKVEIYTTREGSGEWDHPKRTRTFPLDASLEAMAEAILDDYSSRGFRQKLKRLLQPASKLH
jgi:hypothetical protein